MYEQIDVSWIMLVKAYSGITRKSVYISLCRDKTIHY